MKAKLKNLELSEMDYSRPWMQKLKILESLGIDSATCSKSMKPKTLKSQIIRNTLGQDMKAKKLKNTTLESACQWKIMTWKGCRVFFSTLDTLPPL